MANILGVGIATLDIINTVDHFPEEDEELRATSQVLARGGNTTNTLVVLSQLGHQATWAGSLADDDNSQHIKDDLSRYSVDMSPVQLITGGHVPTSYITLNQQNGSRTIVHYRDLAEYSLEYFQNIDLTAFDWLHFEGRNIETTRRMLEYARQKVPQIPRSVEIEKSRHHIGTLCGLADLLLYSRSYVQNEAKAGELPVTSVADSLPKVFLEHRHRLLSSADHVCTWGEEGAYGIGRTGNMVHVPAIKPDRVLDTLGAGDTFLAGLIHGQLKGLTFADSIKTACKLAGQKCGQQGLDGLSL